MPTISLRAVVGALGRLVLLAWLAAGVVVTAEAPAWQRVALAVGVAGIAPWLARRPLGRQSRGPRYERVMVVGLVMAAVGGGLGAGALSGPALTVSGLGVAGFAARADATVRRLVPVVAAAVSAVLVSVATAGGASAFQVVAALGSLALGLAIGALRRQARQTEAVRETSALHQLAAAESRAENAALIERQRIARELHDLLAHSLGGLAVQLSAAEALADAGRTEAVRDSVRTAHRLAVEGLREAREAVAALRGSGALPERVTTLVDAENAVGGQVHAVVADGLPDLTEAATHALERVVREALTNARKHARGAAVRVRVASATGDVVVQVDDDGGSPSAVSSTGAGWGITGMSERVRAVGGTLEAGPSGPGWSVRAVVPSTAAATTTDGDV
ncbi:histidine kinase [Isoptericola sp. NPDC019482]|uniref:sensor histidine kinase n=1 Tax=Isoptericola sp. NPDC019482 TaxID=3154688 RepID=UPI00346D7AA6